MRVKIANLTAELQLATNSTSCDTPEVTYEWWRFVIIVLLIVLSGCFSGLNLGVLGLDLGNLEMLQKGPHESKEDEDDARYAAKIEPLRKKGNLLLCAILLGNVAVNALLSILLANLTSGTTGFLVSTALIVVFGEIVPQAICTRHGLKAGAYLAWLLWILIAFTFFLSLPISFILDWMLGEEVGTVYSKNKLKRIFAMQ
jgi:metal transporter CNNM